ncbi:MAG: hypothetical protein KKF80_01000 [Candidatus Omnitrophica bacterium]|nr:hypothetical protein [Candidatus Omnitrophota bacterium]
MFKYLTISNSTTHRLAPWCALILSLAIHGIIVSSVRLSSSRKQNPVLFVWPGILTTNDLAMQSSKYNQHIDPQLFITHHETSYFPAIGASDYRYRIKEKEPYTFYPVSRLANAITDNHPIRSQNQYYYLWNQPAQFFPDDKTTVIYRAFVSPQGKALIVFPEKLLGDNERNIALQKYVTEASLFFEDKFFWTKLEGVVE